MKDLQINKLDFKGQNIYVGIDVHLKSWSVAILSENAVLKNFVQDPSPEVLHKFLVKNYPNACYYSVYEAGFCGFWVHEKLTGFGINNIVVNPADVPTMFKEKLQKTDAIDCGKLARGLRSGTLKGIYTPRVETLEIRSLIRVRNSIVKDSTREKNRIKAILHFYGIEIPAQFTQNSTGNWSKSFVAWLRQGKFSTEHGRKALDFYIEKYVHLREVLKQVNRVIRHASRDKAYEESLRLITTIPGIGLTIGMTFLVEIDNIDRFKNTDGLASFIGLVPMCHSSGEKVGVGDITIRRHAMLRCYIIQAAWKAVGQDPAMTLAYEEYRKRMIAQKAIVKIARKLVNRIFYVLKRKQEYVPCIVK